MIDCKTFSICTIRLKQERHVVNARQRARDLAAYLGFDHQEQIRLATAASELARNAFRYATGGAVEFLVSDGTPQLFVMSVTDAGPGIPNLTQILDGQYVSKTGMGMGLIGTRRLLDYFEISTSITGPRPGTRVEAGKPLPTAAGRVDAQRIKAIEQKIAESRLADPFEEIELQNQELLKTLAELREKQQILADLNRELEDTNRGVVALYAELDQRAIDLRRISDLKTSFLSNLSHEFRTPLNSITSLSRLLLSHADGSLEPEQEKQVEYIQRSAAELTELVNDLLDLAKVEAGKIDVKPRLFEVQELFGALRGMLRPLLVGNKVDLVFDADLEIPTLRTDEGKVSQILRNLISNALKFTRVGEVRVTAELAPDEYVIFRVSDTGVGISPVDQKRIFEEFVQVEGEFQAGVKGTGLGLPLSRRLAELLGGTIEVQSELGAGSTFVVRLPMYWHDPREVREAVASPERKAGATVLIIEDNRETIFVMESALKNTDYNLVFAANLVEARIALERESSALVVLDRIIDAQDSFHFIEEMKKMGYAGPILALSIVNEPEAALKAGATIFLPKPVPPFTLLNTIRELVEGTPAKTVLLVDDDEVTRYLLGDTLGRLGFRVLEARNGREAIRMAQEYSPHVMFLDITMPDLNGFEVLREIKINPAIREISIIVHSSRSFNAQERSLLADANVVIYPKEPLGDRASSERLQLVLEAAGLSL